MPKEEDEPLWAKEAAARIDSERERHQTKWQNAAKPANEVMRQLLAAAILLSIIGGVLLGIGWPLHETDSLGDTQDGGSTWALLLGLPLITVGSVCLSIWTIAWGVLLGNRATRDESSGAWF